MGAAARIRVQHHEERNSDMTQVEKYRAKATELAVKATRVPQSLQMDYATMAASYLRLAEQAERHTDLATEPSG